MRAPTRNSFYTFSYQKLIYFFLFILCTHGIGLEVQGAYTPTYDAIENFEVEQKVDKLLLLMQKRLVIMHEVARTKWSQNVPIEDKIREQQILADFVIKASQYGLDGRFVTQFFQAQMDAAKEIQKKDFFLWKKNNMPKFEKIFSLKEELRFYIDQLNNEMIALLSTIYSQPLELNSKYVIEQPISIRHSDYIENDIWLLAISPLKMSR